MTGGVTRPHIPRPLWSHKSHPSATARVDDVTALFFACRSGAFAPPTRGYLNGILTGAASDLSDLSDSSD